MLNSKIIYVSRLKYLTYIYACIEVLSSFCCVILDWWNKATKVLKKKPENISSCRQAFIVQQDSLLRSEGKCSPM